MSVENETTSLLLTLKTIEHEINMYIKSYETINTTYIQYIRNKDHYNASKTLSELTQINNTLLSLVTRGQDTLNSAIKNGAIDRKTNNLKQPIFKNISYKLKKQQVMIEKAEKEINNLNGELETTELSKQTNYLQYATILIVGIIVVGLTTKTIITKDDSLLDNVILVIIIGLAIYFIIKKFY